jgi:glutamate-1-semialdehyde 2,1-aminomutase
VRFTASGTEATHLAIRLARAFTGRPKILRFTGHFHGWHDQVAAGATSHFDGSTPVGILPALVDQAIMLPTDDVDRVIATIDARDDIAAAIVEPSGASWGTVPLPPDFLQRVREATARRGIVLIFDEVITGFRLAPGGAQARFGVTPDIATFAKAIANGFPVAAIAGKGEILDLFGKGVVHGGTFNAQPVAMAATLATLDALTPELFAGIETRGRRLMDGIAAELAAAGHKAVVTGWPQVFHVAFDLDAPARNWRDLAKMNRAKYVRFTAALLAHGVRALERGAWFMSAAHDDAIVDQTLAAVRKAARELEAA